MNKFLLLLLLSTACFGQNCLHKNLSADFDFAISIERIKKSEGALDSCRVVIDIIRKQDKKIQKIEFGSGWLYEESFVVCDAVRSYTTGVNKDFHSVDNDFGDLVVADFNFDGLEDLSFKKEEGGNGGPLYFFYLQDKEGEFELDPFLTNDMMFFPYIIDPKGKRLVTLVHANAYQMNETVYELKGKNKWKEISSRLVP